MAVTRAGTASRPPRSEIQVGRQGSRANGAEGITGTRLGIPIRPRRVLVVMLAIAAVLTAVTVVIHLLEPIGSRPADYLLLLELADAAAEDSIANWYSALVMLGCAGAMAWIGLEKRRSGEAYGKHWLALALLFVLFSLDEGAGIHDSTADPLREAFELGGALYLGWVIPWGALAIACGITFTRFLWRLPTGVRGPIVAAGALFVVSALGFELAEAHLYTSSGVTVEYEAALIVEELGEMTALALLSFGLLRALTGNRGASLRLELDPARTEGPNRTLRTEPDLSESRD
jgi:hypothetical protein